MKLCIIHIHKRSVTAKTSESVFSMSLLNPLMGILSILVGEVGEEVIVRARDIFQISGDLLYSKQRSHAGSSTEEAMLVSFSNRHQRNILVPCLKRQKNVEHHLDYNFNYFQSSSVLEEFSKYFPSTSAVSESSELRVFEKK